MNSKTLISLQIEKELLNKIKEKAKQESLNVSSYIRLLCLKDLREKNK